MYTVLAYLKNYNDDTFHHFATLKEAEEFLQQIAKDGGFGEICTEEEPINEEEYE